MAGDIPLWLLLSLMVEFGFGQLFKWAEQKGCHAPTVVSTNYLVMAAILLIYLGSTGRLRLLRVASVLTAFRLSIVVPVGLGMLLWDEPLGGVQVLGLGLALLALLLMSRHAQHRTAVHGLRALAMLALIFALQGMSSSCLRWVHYAGLGSSHLQVLMVIGFTAGTIGAGRALWLARRRPRRGDLAMGAGIGSFNLVALSVILMTLERVPGTVFFPLMGCGVVILDNLTAPLLWKEPLSRAALWGVGMGVLAVVLVL